MHKPSSIRDYVISILIAVMLFAAFLSYLLIRRGYLLDAPPTADMLYVPNKALAGVGVAMIALTFLIGPLTRYFKGFGLWLQCRKEIGIVGGFIVVGHAIVSYFLLPKKSPQSRFTLDNETFVWGLIGTALLVFLFIISFPKMIKWIGAVKWWFLQRWGLRLVILATVLHVVPMKWSGWVKWFNEGGKVTPELAHPLMPGAGILVSVFVAWVIVVRLYESVCLYRNLGLSSKEITSDPRLIAKGRTFFLVSFWIMMMLYVIIITRWMGQ
jgi:DMSO/TMAO reductase YedYZ heme-binding membrane subunit